MVEMWFGGLLFIQDKVSLLNFSYKAFYGTRIVHIYIYA
jgi:hypothetical protein